MRNWKRKGRNRKEELRVEGRDRRNCGREWRKGGREGGKEVLKINKKWYGMRKWNRKGGL